MMHETNKKAKDEDRESLSLSLSPSLSLSVCVRVYFEYILEFIELVKYCKLMNHNIVDIPPQMKSNCFNDAYKV